MHNRTPPSLRELGWHETFEAAFAPHQKHSVPGRVSRSDRGGNLVVETAEGTVRARLAACFRRSGLGGSDPIVLPTVGDWVALGGERIDGQPAVHTVLPRRSAIVRQAPAARPADAQVLAANVDVTLIVAALDTGVNQRRLDRYLVLAWQAGTTPAVVLTKADRCDAVPAAVAAVEAATLGVPVHALSALTGDGVERLAPYLAPGRTAVLLGMSGAGKSTLANRLLGAEVLATQEVRADGQGRHTTTWRELLRLPGGGLLIDTPGLRELGLWDADDGVAEAFGDIEELAADCRFADCRHASEPGCAVTAAAAAGVLAPERLESHRKLQRELAHLARKQDARLRQAEQRRWKQMHRAQRAHYRERDR
ncbi:MAG: ribosome small subunit-dependent GTPase A [Egibacteraceae bacterium]